MLVSSCDGWKNSLQGKLGELALQIAVRHPQSRLRNRTPDNVTQNETEAILDAMANEAQLTSVTMAETGRTILGPLDAWDDVPRGKRGDYRLQPKKLPAASHPTQIQWPRRNK